jgi:hypothetical protein
VKEDGIIIIGLMARDGILEKQELKRPIFGFMWIV